MLFTEMARTWAVQRDNVNMSTCIRHPRILKIAKELTFDEHATLVGLLKDYQDVFAWSCTDMKGLDPQYYQHQIHLEHDA